MATEQVVLNTERLVLRAWTIKDALAALTIFGRDEVTHWLTPAMQAIHDEAAMRAVLESWAERTPSSTLPLATGR